MITLLFVRQKQAVLVFWCFSTYLSTLHKIPATCAFIKPEVYALDIFFSISKFHFVHADGVQLMQTCLKVTCNFICNFQQQKNRYGYYLWK